MESFETELFDIWNRNVWNLNWMQTNEFWLIELFEIEGLII